MYTDELKSNVKESLSLSDRETETHNRNRGS